MRWITIVPAWRRFAAEETAVWLRGRRLEDTEARGWHAGIVLRWITIVCAWDGVILEEPLGVSVAGREGPVFVGGMTGVEDAVWWRVFEKGALGPRGGCSGATKHARGWKCGGWIGVIAGVGCVMGVAHTAGESCLMRRISHLTPSASGSIGGVSGEEFWEWAISRGRGFFRALWVVEETACGACSCCGHLIVDIRTIFHEVNEAAEHIIGLCGELLIIVLGKIIEVTARVGKRAYVFHVICENRTFGATAGDIGTMGSLFSVGLARKSGFHAILLLSEPLKQVLVF